MGGEAEKVGALASVGHGRSRDACPFLVQRKELGKEFVIGRVGGLAVDGGERRVEALVGVGEPGGPPS